MFKSKLQELCQRRSWDLPVYTTFKDGPNHTPRFSATVDVHGQVFDTPAHCKSSKEAQNTAARVAFDFLTAPSPATSDPFPLDMLHMYKNLLQQHAQKENLGLPVYTSEIEGPPHSRRFKSKVSINGKSYATSEFFSTLKESEQMA